jgi:hypothetical protein
MAISFTEDFAAAQSNEHARSFEIKPFVAKCAHADTPFHSLTKEGRQE